MAHPEPGWDLYRTFLAVVQDGTLSAAARRLGLTQPTAGRHIEALEASLGVILFSRSRRGPVPTRAALALVPHAEAMAAASAALRRASSAAVDDARGTVRLTAGQLVGHEVLPSILAAFCLRHPGIEVELVLSDRNEDLVRRDADIAVRMMRPVQQRIVARRIGTVEVGLFAHRRYVEVHGLPDTREDLAHHRLIGFDRDPHGVRSAGGIAAKLRREQFGFRCDSAPMQLAALRTGIGIGGHHSLVARSDPDLIPVLEKTYRFKREMWLAMHRDSKTTRPIRLLFEHLAASLTNYVLGKSP
jgi:DNA-binding transcriptional LysR family regulator